MQERPVWFPEEREALADLRRQLAGEQGGAPMLRDAAAEVRDLVQAAARQLERCRGRCVQLLRGLAEESRRRPAILQRCEPGPAGSACRTRGYYAWCILMRGLEAGERELNTALLHLAGAARQAQDSRAASLRAVRLCRAALSPLPGEEPCSPECLAAAREALAGLEETARQNDALQRQLEEIRETVGRFCREEMARFRIRSAELADAAHQGAAMRPAALFALCGEWIHAAASLAGQLERSAGPGEGAAEGAQDKKI